MGVVQVMYRSGCSFDCTARSKYFLIYFIFKKDFKESGLKSLVLDLNCGTLRPLDLRGNLGVRLDYTSETVPLDLK